jgi:hypothetical protein
MTAGSALLVVFVAAEHNYSRKNADLPGNFKESDF